MSIRSLLLTLLLLPAMNTFAGGYHCRLLVKEFKMLGESRYEVKLQKFEADKAFYKKDLKSWEMVS